MEWPTRHGPDGERRPLYFTIPLDPRWWRRLWNRWKGRRVKGLAVKKGGREKQ
jgi:hypothetical protein